MTIEITKERTDWVIIRKTDTVAMRALDIFNAKTGEHVGVLSTTTTLHAMVQIFLPGVTSEDMLVDRDRAEVLRMAEQLRREYGPNSLAMVGHILAERWAELIQELERHSPPTRSIDTSNVIALAKRRQGCTTEEK